MALKDDYGRTIEMLCPTCGASQFEYDDDIESPVAWVQCAHCEREFDKQELIDWNQDRITGNVEDVKREVVDDVKRDLRKRLKKIARGNKNIRFK